MVSQLPCITKVQKSYQGYKIFKPAKPGLNILYPAEQYGMLTNQQSIFFGQSTLRTLLSGSSLWCFLPIFGCLIYWNSILYTALTIFTKIFTFTAVHKICTLYFYCSVQNVYTVVYKIATAPFSTRPGVYKECSARKSILLAILAHWIWSKYMVTFYFSDSFFCTPFSCDVCDKRYAGLHSLKSHKLNIHGLGGKKPRCRYCDKSFYNNTLLRKHVLEHHEKDPRLECKICGQFYLRKDNLEAHIQR